MSDPVALGQALTSTPTGFWNRAGNFAMDYGPMAIPGIGGVVAGLASNAAQGFFPGADAQSAKRTALGNILSYMSPSGLLSHAYGGFGGGPTQQQPADLSGMEGQQTSAMPQAGPYIGTGRLPAQLNANMGMAPSTQPYSLQASPSMNGMGGTSAAAPTTAQLQFLAAGAPGIGGQTNFQQAGKTGMSQMTQNTLNTAGSWSDFVGGGMDLGGHYPGLTSKML